MKIKNILKNSISERRGLNVEDELISINGSAIRDQIDLRFYQTEPRLKVRLKRNDKVLLVDIEKDIDRDLGIELEEPKYRVCGNKCIFCFVDQMPQGLRPPLYFKDEDFRLSFLHGNYLTLSNFGLRDLVRIAEQGLSPLYISVHTTDDALREKMLGARQREGILDSIQKLVDRGIKLHCQIVLCPGINDGEHLEKTVHDLVRLHTGVASVSVVPVGLTKHRRGLYKLKPVTRADAQKLIAQYKKLQYTLRKRFNKTVLYFSDEFYLKAGLDIPDSFWYDEYPQIDNGVGMVRQLWDDFEKIALKLPSKFKESKEILLVTGVLGKQALEPIITRLRRIENSQLTVLAVKNILFGRMITVSGLLSGSDILRAMRGRFGYHMVALPGNLLNQDGLFIDSIKRKEFTKSLSPAAVTFGLKEMTDQFVRWGR